MAAQAADTSPGDAAPSLPRGPNPGSVTLSAPYISQVKIDRMKVDLGLDPVKEETSRLQGVELIHKVRTSILLPIKTFDTACCYYHKFRLCYRDNEYAFADVALASLFVACKTEDTPKKSREILCAAYNLKNAGDQKTPDDKSFDHPAKVIIGLERMILELVSFDMSGRYPQHPLPKVVRGLLLSRADQDGGRNADLRKSAAEVYAVAYDMSIDIYKTFAPLKQTTYTLSLSLFELSCRLLDRHSDVVSKINPRRWHTSRACVVETMLDLLDLYSDCSKNTLLCAPDRGHEAVTYSSFLRVKIDLNQEVEDTPSLERYSLYCGHCKTEPMPRGTSSGLVSATPNVFGVPIKFNTGTAFLPLAADGSSLTTTPRSASIVASPSSLNGAGVGSAGGAAVAPASRLGRGSMGTSMPSQPAGTTTAAAGPNRFVFDRDEAKREGELVNQFFEDRYEEYEVEVEEVIPEPVAGPAPPSYPSNPPTAPAEARRGGPPPRGPSFGDGPGWGRRRGGGPPLPPPYERRGPPSGPSGGGGGPRGYH